jgi:hypothetical protein
MKIYVDMDGVLTNFKESVRNLGKEPALGLEDNATEPQKQVMYDAIEKAGPKFWASMSWTKDGKSLWDAIKKYNPVLLSSPGEFRDAPRGKEEWVKNNIPGIVLILETEKWRYAERNAILIDDTDYNVGAWEEYGGIGILHRNAITTMKKLLEVIRKRPILTLAQAIRNIIPPQPLR